MQTLIDAICESTKDYDIPSISLNVRVNGEEVFHHTRGVVNLVTGQTTMENQLYDLASLTKILVTTPIVASLVEEGALSLDTPLSSFLGDLDPRITLSQILTHTAGFAAWMPFYREIEPLEWGAPSALKKILQRAAMSPLAHDPGTVHEYSDIGFLVLMQCLQNITGQELSTLFTERICVPNQISTLTWGGDTAAATEQCPVRDRLIVGEVHDLNGSAMGGVSTHAGLFGDARSVGQLAEAYMNALNAPDQSPLLPGRALGEFAQHRGLGSHYCGFDGISATGYTSTGRFFPDDTIGHLGYTGTSLWMSPSKRCVVTCLTNRIHPVDEKSGIRHVRPIIHDAVARFLNWDKESTCVP